MIKTLNFIILFSVILFLSNCSFKNPGNFFKDKEAELQKEILKKNSKLVFKTQKQFDKEISGTVDKKIPILSSKKWLQTNFTTSNFVPHLEYQNQKNLVYKSKKIGKNKFDLSDPFFEPLFSDDQMFFYDFSGNIYKFSILQKKLIWKFNFYKKRYKNIPIKIKLKISNKNLIVADNLGYVYSIQIENGKLNWAKNYGIPFRSNIKVGGKNIFVLNQDNKFYSIDKNDGSQNLNLETFPSFLKSKQETHICLDTNKNNIYFVTSTGQLYSINYVTKNINWLSTIFLSGGNKSSDLFYSSPIICKNEKIFFSSSDSTFSINSSNGNINWKLPFATDLRPIVTENFIFLASKNGFFLNTNSKTGKVIWSKDLFKNNKKINRKKIGEINSIMLVSDQILATTKKGFFLFIDYQNGKIINYTKASRAGFFSNPILVDKRIYLIDKKMRILILN